MKILTLVLIVFLALAMVGCSDESGAKELLAKQGYTEIKITGYRPFACSDDDDMSTGFSAKNQNGVIVTGTVCSTYGGNAGFGKLATIRFDE